MRIAYLLLALSLAAPAHAETTKFNPFTGKPDYVGLAENGDGSHLTGITAAQVGAASSTDPRFPSCTPITKYGADGSGLIGAIASWTNASTIVLSTGQGSKFKTGDKIVLGQSANMASYTGRSQHTVTVSGDTLTLSPSATVQTATDVYHDSEPALLLAIAATSAKGCVSIPAGTYYLGSTSAVNLTASQSLIGEGKSRTTVYAMPKNYRAFRWYAAGQDVDGVEVSGLTLDGMNNPVASTFSGPYYTVGLQFGSFQTEFASNYSRKVRIHDSEVRNFSNTAVMGYHAYDWKVYDNRFYNADGGAVLSFWDTGSKNTAITSENIVVQGNKFEKISHIASNFYGVHHNDADYTQSYQIGTFKDIKVTGNTYDDVYLVGNEFYGNVFGATAANNYFRNCGYNSSFGNAGIHGGLSIKWSQDITVSNNVMEGCYYGLETISVTQDVTRGLYPAKNITVTGITTKNSQSAGISFQSGSQGVRLSGFHSHDNLAAGVVVTSDTRTTSDIYIDNGDVDGYGVVVDAATGQNIQVSRVQFKGGSLSDTGGNVIYDNAVYDATSWNGVTDQPPSKDAVRDKIEALAASGVWGNITGTLSSQTDLNTALSGKVPYSGAAGAVDLNGQSLSNVGALASGLHTITTTDTGGKALILARQAADTVTTTLQIRKRGATGDANAVLPSGSIYGNIQFAPYNGGGSNDGYLQGPYIAGYTREAQSSTAHGNGMLFSVTPNGNSSNVVSLFLNHNGNAAVGNNSSVTASPATLMVRDGTASTGTTRLLIAGGATANDATSNKLLEIRQNNATPDSGTSVFSVTGAGNVAAAGSVSGSQLASTVATGTAPFSITSITLSTNLNADLLDGQHGSYYAPINAPTITGHPTIEGVTSTGATGTGKLVFDTAPTLANPTVGGGIYSQTTSTTIDTSAVSGASVSVSGAASLTITNVVSGRYFDFEVCSSGGGAISIATLTPTYVSGTPATIAAGKCSWFVGKGTGTNTAKVAAVKENY